MARPSHALALLLALGCSADSKSAAPGASPSATPVAIGAAAPAQPPIAAPCELNAEQPGPLRRAGRARVKLSGAGLTVDAEVPAICGPLFNRDVEALAVKAGEGLLYETCLPEGAVQLISRQRNAGTQQLHGGATQPAAMDVSFNRTAGATYSSRGLATDRVTLSEDFWKADAELVLRDVEEKGELRASLAFDCSAAPAVEQGAAATAPPRP